MMKKFISVLICALMLLALGAPAFASYESEAEAIIAHKKPPRAQKPRKNG